MMRSGHGYDVHKLVEGRKLILGGVEIPYYKGLLGHSDADVLTHALMDALLGAAALGDIGGLFPDNDDAYLGADSIELLKTVEEQKVFAKDAEMIWICRNCGHIHVGPTAPEKCPVCNHPQAYFQLYVKAY